jgi:hypothetical protein
MCVGETRQKLIFSRLSPYGLRHTARLKPLFTIHAGECLVGLHVQKFKLNVWIPAKDTGIDLLVTDSAYLGGVSLQVKDGKDFLPEEKKPDLRRSLRFYSLLPTGYSLLYCGSARS